MKALEYLLAVMRDPREPMRVRIDAGKVLAALLALTSTVQAWDARPHEWCGWYARHYLVSVDPGTRFNKADEWFRWGRYSARPCLGCMVVWSHHVEKITGACKGLQCLVTSGNVNGVVMTYVKDLRGAQFRSPL